MTVAVTGDFPAGADVPFAFNAIRILATSLTYPDAGSTQLTTSRPLNSNGQADSTVDAQGATLFQSLTYLYDRDRVTQTRRNHEGTSWRYGYDSRGQVTGADKYFDADEASASYLVNGLRTGYTYDMAGNRTTKFQGPGSQQTTNYGAANNK